jgi:hypothetical protein
MTSAVHPDIETEDELRVSYDTEAELDSALSRAEEFSKKHKIIKWGFVPYTTKDPHSSGYIFAKPSDKPGMFFDGQITFERIKKAAQDNREILA